MGHPGRATRAEAVEIGPPDAHRLGAEAQRLDDVAAAAHAAVEQDLGAPAHPVGDRRERVEGCHRAVELATPVVRDDDARRPEVDGAGRILGVEDALDVDRAVPLGAHPGEVVPDQLGPHPAVLGLDRAHGGGHPLVTQEPIPPLRADRRAGDPGRREDGRGPHPPLALALPVAVDGHVDGDEQGAVAGLLGAVDEGLGQGAGAGGCIGPRVELEEVVLLRGGTYLLNGVGGRRTQDGPGSLAFRRLGRAHFTGPVRNTRQAGRCQEDGHRQGDAGHLDSQVLGVLAGENPCP
jgi:hypothetical protein